MPFKSKYPLKKNYIKPTVYESTRFCDLNILNGKPMVRTNKDRTIVIKPLKRSNDDPVIVLERIKRAINAGAPVELPFYQQVGKKQVLATKIIAFNRDNCIGFIHGGESLSDFLLKNNLSKIQIINLFTQFCIGLAKLHSAKIIHNDLFVKNIIVGRVPTGFKLRFVDFETSADVNPDWNTISAKEFIDMFRQDLSDLITVSQDFGDKLTNSEKQAIFSKYVNSIPIANRYVKREILIELIKMFKKKYKR